MQQEIENYNKNIPKLCYRLGDSIRHNNIAIHNLKDSFTYKYYRNRKISYKDDPTIHFELLYNIVLDSDYKQCPCNSIIFNLRLNEWFDWPYSKVVSNDTNYEFIQEHNDLLKKLDNIFILYGATIKSN